MAKKKKIIQKPIYSLQVLILFVLISLGEGSGIKGFFTFGIFVLLTFYNLWWEIHGV